jgi:hypothetical protein
MVNKTNIIVNQKIFKSLKLADDKFDLKGTSDAINTLIEEMGEGFYNYINSIGLSKDPNLIVLSSLHNYFYDAEEMNNVKTIINLKELNKIDCIKDVLHSYSHSLPLKCNFIGYFINNNKINRYGLRKRYSCLVNGKRVDEEENGIVSRFPFLNMLFSVMDSKTNTYMSKISVVLLLEDYGFKALDMTEYNDLTFFHSQKVKEIYN